MIGKISSFINREIWRIPLKHLKGPKGMAIRFLRILILSFKEFSKDKCALQASALTFYSLLSIVPVFAMAFGIAKGFGMDKLLREKIMEGAQGQQEILNYVLTFAENFLQNTKGGLIAGIGLALLFWTIIQVLTSIEEAFNHIWGIKTPRALGQKFTDYLALMLVAPIFFIIASSATVFVVSQVELITRKIAILGVFGPIIFAAMKFIPLAIFCGLLTYLYIFMPNGKIQFKSALLGGLVAGGIYQMVQWAYIHFQIGASSAGAIYGTFAALPLFLTWVQLSWRIVLYGSELAFAHQNERRFEFEQESQSASESFKKLLALRITHLSVSRFAAGLAPLSDEEMADQLELPIRLTRDLLHQLVAANVLVGAQGVNERDRRYQPAQDITHMTVHFVLQQLEKSGTQDIPIAETLEMIRLREALNAFESETENLPQNVLLRDITLRSSKVFSS